MQFGKCKLTMCRYGWMLHFGPYIGKCFELYGQYSESEVSVLRGFLRPGDTAIDIGANIGDLTVPMSRLVGPEGRVYAIESHSETYQVLCANLALNGIRNTKPVNCFIADAPDVETGGEWGTYGYVSKTWGASIVPLDALGVASCALIKIDVDGKELEVLRSGAELIGRCRPVLYFENDQKNASPALLGHAAGLGYELYWHPAPIFDPDNFFGNPVNHWAPRNIMSLMVLGVPSEKAARFSVPLKKVTDATQWWDTVLSA